MISLSLHDSNIQKKKEPLLGMISWCTVWQGFMKDRKIAQPENSSWDTIR